MWGCNIHNCVHYWRGNKLFHEQNEGNLFPVFLFIPPAELFLLFLRMSCKIHRIFCKILRISCKTPYHMTVFTDPGPSYISSSPLPSPKCLQSILHLPLVLPSSLPLLGWPVKYSAWYPCAFQPCLDWAKSWGCSAFFSSEGHQQWLSQAQTRKKLVYLCQSVKIA